MLTNDKRGLVFRVSETGLCFIAKTKSEKGFKYTCLEKLCLSGKGVVNYLSQIYLSLTDIAHVNLVLKY